MRRRRPYPLLASFFLFLGLYLVLFTAYNLFLTIADGVNP